MYTNMVYFWVWALIDVLISEKEWKKLTVEVDVEVNQQFAFVSRNGGGHGISIDDVTLVPGPCDIPGINVHISHLHFSCSLWPTVLISFYLPLV